MTILIGILAMFVAFVALWLGSMAMKKSEDQFSQLAKALRGELGKMRGEVDATVATATKRINALERRIEEIQSVDGATRETLDVVRRELMSLREELNATQTALPPQYRRRTKGGEQRANN
ncbi:MAG: hypothetical protein HOH04_04515 [Rhodospirillaceae bacterium]|jgi:chromosome segregation ATPase|nr:hypothetical protein [Rhodospirillaceae bacterium]